LIFASAITFRQDSVSSLISAANSAGAAAIDSNNCGSRNFDWKVGSARMRRTSSLILAMMEVGVPAVVASPNQVPAR
jgi:hypothetical protein